MSIELDDETKLKIWSEIMEEEKAKTELLPGEKTIRMYAEETGLSHKQASARLEQLEDKGILISYMKLIRGKHCHVYKPIKQ